MASPPHLVVEFPVWCDTATPVSHCVPRVLAGPEGDQELGYEARHRRRGSRFFSSTACRALSNGESLFSPPPPFHAHPPGARRRAIPLGRRGFCSLFFCSLLFFPRPPAR